MNGIRPGQNAPRTTLPTVRHGRWTLTGLHPHAFEMLVFYRGKHCLDCKKYLKKLVSLVPQFRRRGVQPIAISMDDETRARESVIEWELGELPVAYGLTEDAARHWGLFISDAIKPSEPGRFSEPGLFLVQPDGLLHYAAITSMTFGRPDLGAMLDAIDYLQEHDDPPRGRVPASPVAA